MIENPQQTEKPSVFYRAFRWIFYLPKEFAVVLAAGLFGLFGGMVRLVFTTVKAQKVPTWLNVSLLPVFGMLVGLLVLAAQYVVPFVLVANTQLDLRPITLTLLSMFGGVFSMETYEVIQKKVMNAFARGKDKSSGRDKP